MAQLTDQDMMAVKAIAPFEVAEIFAEWARRWDQLGAETDPAKVRATVAMGRPERNTRDRETPEQFGHRVAVALFTLLKEV